MNRTIGIISFLLCSALVQAAEPPPMCRTPKPIPDLGGKLPAPDYLDSVLACMGEHTMADSRIPQSEWLKADAKRYAALLGKNQYPLLVLPAQTQFQGFDFAERALIGAEISEVFGKPGAMPDTQLVARALGEVRRRFKPYEVQALTQATRAGRRLEVYAGHDGNHKLTLTLQLYECTAGANCKLLKQRDWRALPFSDAHPPFRVVNGLQAEIRKEFAVAAKPETPRPPPTVGNLGGLTPAQAMDVKYAPTATVSALLAAVAPGEPELARQRLAASNLRLWAQAPKGSEGRLFAAFAAADLQRRPYALAFLEGMNDPAAQALRELLNGNLPESEKKVAAVSAPLPRLLLELRLRELASAYGRTTRFDNALLAPVFGASAQEWQVLIQRKLRDSHYSGGAEPFLAKRLLDLLAPSESLSLKSVLVGSTVVGKPPDVAQIQLANFRHLEFALDHLARAECCAPAVAGGGRWSMYWLLEGLVQADVIRDLRYVGDYQALPARAAELVRIYEGILGGEPSFEMQRARSAARTGKEAENADAKRYEQAYEKAEELITYWSQGQTPASANTVLRGSATLAFAEGYSQDFPRRSYWRPVPGMPTPPAGSGSCASLEYSISDAEPAEGCLEDTAPAAKRALASQLRRRFHGSPEVPILESWLASVEVPAVAVAPVKPAGGAAALRTYDDAARLASARGLHAQDPESWNAVYDLGLLTLQRRGDYEVAQKTFLGFPGFKVPTRKNAVELSNQAYIAGSDLFWAGRVELGRPLYEIAAQLDTGSNSSLVSAARLAQLDGHYGEAAEIFLATGARYSSPYAFRDGLSLLFVTGRADEARSGFQQIARSFEIPQVWVAELVGQRIDGTSYEKMKSWILGDDVRNARYRGMRFAPYYALVWATTDRTPSADFPVLMDHLERDADRVIDSGMVSRPHPNSEKSREVIWPSQFRAGKATPLPSGTRVKSEYALFADALTATLAGRFGPALAKFDALADLYSVDNMMGLNYALPYYARAAAKTGDKAGFEAFVDKLSPDGTEFDVLLAQATFAAVRRDVANSEALLARAMRFRPHSDARPMMTEYTYAEVCEFVARETGDARFTRMLLDWAKRQQKMQPTHAWGYAVEAQYSADRAAADRALAITLYLDPQSPRLKGIDSNRRAAASAWLKANNPFLETKPKSKVQPGV